MKIEKQKFTNTFFGILGFRSFGNFTQNTLALKSFFKKVAGPQPCNFITKRLQHRCFPVKFAKFLRAPFLQKASGGYFLR